MAGPNATVIGRVAVKVVPDTSKFRDEARAKLKREEERLPKVKVHATFDSTGLKAEILKAIRALNAELASRDAYKVKLRATLSNIGMRGEIRRAVREANALAREQDNQVKIASTSLDAAVNLSQSSLTRVEKELNHWRRKVSPLKIAVIPDFVNGSGVAAATRLRVLTRPRVVDISVKINKPAYVQAATAIAALAGGRVLFDVLDGIFTRLKRLDKAVPIIGTVAVAMAGLTAGIATSASNLFALSSSLAQIGPAALALPGIFGGIAIGLGATVAVAKDFNQIFPEMGDRVHALQDAMSEKFWAKAEAPMRHFIDTLFPLFSKSIIQTSSELGDFFAGFSRSLGDSLGPILTSMFDDLNTSIDIAGKHTDAFANIIAILGSVGAGYLPKLAAYFGKISDSFSAFLSRTSADGRLKGWIDAGIFQLKELGRALGGIGKIFYGIGTAAEKAGGSTLTILADTLHDIADVVNGPAFQSGLIGFLSAAHAGFTTIGQVAGPALIHLFETLGKTSQSVFPIMGAVIGEALRAVASALSQPEVQQGLTSLFSGLLVAVRGLAPAMGPLGQALGSIFQIVGQLAAVMGPVLGVAIAALSRVIVALTPALLPLIDALGSGLANALKAIAPSVVGLGSTLAGALKVLVPALKPIFDVLLSLASAVLPIFIKGISEVIKAVLPLVPVFAKLFAILGPLLVPVLKLLATLLVDTIVTAVKGVVNVITGVIQVFQGLIDFVVGVFTGNWSKAWDGIKEIFSGIWKLIVGIVEIAFTVGILGVVRKGFAVVKALFSGSWTAIVDVVKLAASSIQARFKTFMADLLGGTVSKLTAIKQFFSGVWGDIRAAISLVWSVIRGIISGAIGAIRATISNGFNAVRSIISSILNGVRTVVRAAWDGIKELFSGGVSGVLDRVAGLPGKILHALGNLGSLLYGAGKAIIQGLIDGIGAMFGKLGSFLGGVGDFIKKHKGPPEYDRVMLVPAGKLIIDGLIEGLESRYGAVKKSLRGLSQSVSSTEITGPSLALGSASGGLAARLSAAVDGSLSGDAAAQKTFNYYANGQSLGAEEDLFKAVNRGRMVGW